jgi:hypothetical protein
MTRNETPLGITCRNIVEEDSPMKITPMERNDIRRCAAIVWENHPEEGLEAVQCRNNATSWVETIWHAARRYSSLDGATIARFTKKNAACDAHATAARARVDLLTR